MKEKTKDVISNICAVVGALLLLYALCDNYYTKQIPFRDTIQSSLIDYMITFIPIVAGVMVHIREMVDEGFHGPKTAQIIFKPLVMILMVWIQFYVIRKFSMNTGDLFRTDESFLEGTLILTVVALFGATILAYLEHDFPHAVFARNTFWITLLTLAFVNSCLQANREVILHFELESVIKWIALVLRDTVIYAIAFVIYIPVLIISMLYWLLGGAN